MSKVFQVDKLLGFMQEEPSRQWKASDFQHDPRFIGYEAGPRLCDLCNMGLVCRVGKQGRFVLFALTESGRKALSTDDRYKLQTPITKEKTEEVFNPETEPDFVGDEPQLSPEDTVGDLAGSEYPKPTTHVQPYKGGFMSGILSDGVRLFRVQRDGGKSRATEVTATQSEPVLSEVNTGKVLFRGSPTDILILALCKRFDVFPKREIFSGAYTVFPVKFS